MPPNDGIQPSDVLPSEIFENYSPGPARFRVYLALSCAAVAMFLVVMVGAAPLHGSEGKGPVPGSRPLDAQGRMQVSPEDRCPVCGMKVVKYPKFSAALQLQDGTTFYFCGTGCMIRSWLHPEIFLNAQPADLKRPVVKAYFTGRQTDAREVIFVAGSNVIGPMGPALVPVPNAAALEVFEKRHGGRAQFRLEELTDERWVEITGKGAAQ